MLSKFTKPISIALFFFSFAHHASATVVEVRTTVGDFQINLFDETTPQTVQNFLSYVNAGAYANNVVHRTSPSFVAQMGGFQFNDAFPPDAIATGAAVTNEPELSNVRGTIAMAKLGGNPNSATSQFFVNLANNASNLDVQNGGFTVFGQVIGDGMAVVDAIAALPRFGFAAPFNEIPLRDYTGTDATNNVEVTIDNVVLITDIVVIDPAVSTNPTLNPVPNTLIDQTPTTPTTPNNDSGGGSFGVFLMLGLFASVFWRRRR